MSRDLKAKFDVERYRPLGLVANPFTIADYAQDFTLLDVETAAEANRLLGEIIRASNEATPKPIAVLKSQNVMSSYPLRAIGRVERSLAGDAGLNVLHAYVQLFMMRAGRIRAMIQILGERLAFNDFDKTLEMYIARVLEQPDSELIGFQVLGKDGLTAFAERFQADPTGVTQELFGGAEVERHPELVDMPDVRLSGLDPDIDEAETSAEIDSTLGDSPANAILLAAQAEETKAANNDQELVDYIVEHTKVHLSPVVARALRVYRERGQASLSDELQITKAPKKTLKAIVRFARCRFKKVALVFDGFDIWSSVAPELRVQIVTSLSEVRWLLENDALIVPLIEEGKVPELEEQFSAATRVDWTFPGLANAIEKRDVLDRSLVESWFARAAFPGSAPLTFDDPVLQGIAAEATTLNDFALRAGTAIENAADRGVATLDEEALAEARTATLMEATEE